jgi:hypothetical protein
LVLKIRHVPESAISKVKNGFVSKINNSRPNLFPTVVRSHREIQDWFTYNKLSETGAAPIENKFLINMFILPIRFPFLSDCIVREDSKMKRIALFFLTVSFMAFVCAAVSNAQTGEDSCTRQDLTKITDKYFESIQEHKASDLPLASTARLTENGVKKDVGKGFWETAGKPLLKRTLIDTRKCVTATIAVIEEPFSSKTVRRSSRGGMGGFGGGGTFGAGARGGADRTSADTNETNDDEGKTSSDSGSARGGRGGMMGGGAGAGFSGMFGGPRTMPEEGTVRPILFAARLRVEKGKIIEIETIVARESDFAFNAENVLKTKDQDWETILPLEKRTSRKVLADAANHYFDLFANNSTVSVPFAEVCDRWENGLQTTASNHDCSPVTFRKQTGTSLNHGPRRVWVDTEKGISIAFMAFGGGASASEENPTGSGLVDCHMFRMRDGKVDLIQSIVGPNAASMGWPLEQIE